jgi:hypothetical protein
MNQILRFALVTSLVLGATTARAEVVRVEVARRAAVGSSGYEKVVGTLHFAVDPRDPRNVVIADLDRAPRNAEGRVEFSADLYLLRPLDAARSNGVALVEVSNRGRKGLLSGFNRAPGGLDPSTDADLGDQFLMQQGYTLVWVGWQFDVPREGGRMRLDAPAVAGLEGVVRAEFTPDERTDRVTVTDLAGYAPADPAMKDATLTVRDGPFGRADLVPRGRWTGQGHIVSLQGGFEPGRTYELAFRAADLPVAGLGLAAFRDTASWLRHGSNAPARARYAIAWGSSQSGRFLRTFLYYGFNADERGRLVFDGVMAHIAGAARLSLNERGATPNSLGMFSITTFPFADARQRDPLSGREEGLLDNDRARAHHPKIFYTNTSVEYWGGGRAAALVHVTPDGRSDVPLPDNVRAYLFAGTQHSPSQFPPRVNAGQQPDNPVQYWWTLRALLTAMDGWVRDGTAPPASQYPRLANRTLVAADRVAFPEISDVVSPRAIPAGREQGRALPLLVSEVDADGNEVAGIRLPEVAVPLATYTGWNFRHPRTGGPVHLVNLLGASIPFAKTRTARETAGDPRRSIAERYRSKSDYLARVREAADRLVERRYLLSGDVAPILERADALWELAAGAGGDSP